MDMDMDMESILRLHDQDNTGTLLREHFDAQDPSLEESDHIPALVLQSLRTHASSLKVSEYGSDCLSLIRAVLRASPEDEHGKKRRSQVLKGSVEWLVQAGESASEDSVKGVARGNNLVDEMTGKLVNALIDIGQSFPQEALVESIYSIVELVRHQQHPHSQAFALLSRILVIVANSDSVIVPSSSEEISGLDFKAMILDRICTVPWNPKSVLPLATALGDLDMDSKQLEAAVVKIMKQFKLVDATDLPVLIYNLLLLSSKGHRGLVISGTFEFFDRLDAGGAMANSLISDNPKGAARLAFPELSAIESTAVLHFGFAVKQDQELGLQLLKHMKGGKTSFLSSFSLTCLMTMARIHRFEDNVMDYLKSSILSVFKDAERMKRETWVTEFHGMSPTPLLHMFCDIIRKIPYGLEQLIPSIVLCGVYIMDTMAPTSSWKTSDKDIPRKLTPKTANEFACDLGAKILAETFKTQSSARTEILDHIMSRIVTKSSSTIFFLQLLETIVKDSPEELEEHLPRIKESLDYLSFLSLTTAIRLMAAVKDVAKANRSFRDSLILILRKALFSKTLESRKVALSGFLLLLGPSPAARLTLRGSSRAIAHTDGDTDIPGYAIEILGMLRRCLGQQGDVRLAFYSSLMELMESSPSLVPIIFEIVHAHFTQFYDHTGTRSAPLKLEECVANSNNGGEPTLTEPLQYLMSCVVRSLIGVQRRRRRSSGMEENNVADERQVEDAQQTLDRVLLGLDRAELEDFGLEGTSDFNMATSIGARNNMYASLLIGCYESAIEYTVLKGQGQESAPHGKTPASQRRHPIDTTLSNESLQLILNLFGKMRKLHDIVREKVAMPRGKKLGPLGEASILGMECITRLLENIFVEPSTVDDRHADVPMLRKNDDFVYYITTVAHVSLSQLNTHAETLREEEYAYCRQLCKVLVREFLVSDRASGPKALAAGAKSKDKNKSWLMVGIEGITAGLMILQRFHGIPSPMTNMPLSSESAESAQKRKVVAGFLAAVLPQVNGGHQPDQQPADVVAWTTSCTINPDIDSLASAFIRYLEALFVLFVNETIPLLKEAAGLLSLIQLLSKYLDRSNSHGATMEQDGQRNASSHLDQLVYWLVKACREQPIDDPALARAMLSMLLQLETESTTPEENAKLTSMTTNMADTGLAGAAGTLGFGQVTASSLIVQCPQAAVRMRLAGDVLLTHGINLSSQQDLHEIQPHRDMDEDTERLLRLREEIGIEPVFAVVTMRTVSAVTDVLLQQVDQSLEALEWALTKLRYCGLHAMQPSSGSASRCTKRTGTGDLQPMIRSDSSLSSGSSTSGPVPAAAADSRFDPHGQCRPNDCVAILPSFNGKDGQVTKKTVQEFETEICWRVEICMWILVRISLTNIDRTSGEHLIRVLQRCYKVLTALTKHYVTPVPLNPLNLFPPIVSSGSSLTGISSMATLSTIGKSSRGSGSTAGTIQIPHGFLRVTQVAGLELSRHVYTFLSFFQLLDEEQKAIPRQNHEGDKGKSKGQEKKGKGKAHGAEALVPWAGEVTGNNTAKSRQKAKILRESKLIPMLIYGVEQYERFVIQLSKKSKVNLTQFMRRSIARDFRIHIQRLGDLGLEDQYDQERQEQQERRLLQQQQQRPHGGEEGQEQDMDMDVDMAHHNGDDNDEEAPKEEEEEEEEALVQSRKRAKH